MSINENQSDAFCQQVGQRAKLYRLELGLTRQALSELTGVPESTLKKFELTGEIGSHAMFKLMNSLGLPGQVEALFQRPQPIAKVPWTTSRKRGVRSDAGISRTTGKGGKNGE